MIKSISVGKVKIDYIEGVSTEYSDGDSEDQLLNLFQGKNVAAEVKKILNESDSWPLIYHLSPQRGNLLSWYDFIPGSTVLEIGSGPGAITSTLTEKNLKVTGIDISERRSLINAHRHKDRDNLNLVVGNFDSYAPKEKFDYVVCIGVLEYAGSFVQSDKPYEYFLERIKQNLKPGGKLLLAIENKFGLKYWAGIPEDHTGNPGDSIQDYASATKKVRTFSKQELSKLITSIGFNDPHFFFPHPDYKLPSIIFSEDLYPGKGTDFPLSALPSNDYSGNAQTLAFNEQLAMLSVEKVIFILNSLIHFWWNAMSRAIKTVYIRNRINPDFAVSTTIEELNGKLVVRKSPTTSTAAKHILSLQKNYELLVNSKISQAVEISTPLKSSEQEFTAEFIKGESLEHKLQGLLFAKDFKQFIFEFDKLKQLTEPLVVEKSDNKLPFASDSQIAKFSEHMSPGNIDLNTDNFIVDKTGRWHMIDYEWCFDGTVPKDFVFVRSLYIFFERASLGVMGLNIELVKITENVCLPKEIYDYFKEDLSKLTQVLSLEKKFQDYVNGKESEFGDSAVEPIKFVPEPSLGSAKYALSQEKLTLATQALHEINEEAVHLRKHIQLIEDSKTYKLARKLSSAYNKIKP